MRSLLHIVVLLGMLVMTGCEGATVLEDRSQREAIEVVALLGRHGVSATTKKEKSGKAKYAVEVDRSSRSFATALLAEKGYPREDEATFSELVSSGGLMPSSREVEAIKLDHAASIELEDLIKGVAGITGVKAVVRSRSVGEGAVPTVSVVLTAGTAAKINVDEIKALISKAISGVSNEQIYVVLHQADETLIKALPEGLVVERGSVVRKNLVPFMFWFLVPEENYNTLSWTLVCCLIVMLVAGGLVGYWYGAYQQARGLFEDADNLTHGLKLERNRSRELPGN